MGFFYSVVSVKSNMPSNLHIEVCPQCGTKNSINSNESRRGVFSCSSCKRPLSIHEPKLYTKKPFALGFVGLALLYLVLHVLPPLLKSSSIRASQDTYIKYLKEIDYRDQSINIYASKIVRYCKENDKACEAKHIARYVADRIQYRSDPAIGDDYIKAPLHTLKAQAGDCEDKTILAISLMGTLGLSTLMVFEKNHAYPMVCFKEKVANKYLDSDVSYELHDGRICYATEPTAKNSGIGVEKDLSLVTAIYDATTLTRIE